MNKTSKLLPLNYPMIIAGLIIIITAIYIIYYVRNPLGPRVQLGTCSFNIKVAATAQQKERGLGYRENLPMNEGMLFPYDHKEQYVFWMKGMNFPLDFVWIDGTTIMEISTSIPVLSNGEITTIKPMTPVDKILEVNSGAISRCGIKVGDRVKFKMY